jgi:hypothetical protein
LISRKKAKKVFGNPVNSAMRTPLVKDTTKH